MLFETVREIGARAQLANRVGEIAVAVQIVGREDDLVLADDRRGVRETFLVRLARDEAALALHVLARRLGQVRKLVRAGIVVIVHAPHQYGSQAEPISRKTNLMRGYF